MQSAPLKPKALPKWMHKRPIEARYENETLKDAARCVRESAKQARKYGFKENARAIDRVADDLECASRGDKTWAEAFDLVPAPFLER